MTVETVNAEVVQNTEVADAPDAKPKRPEKEQYPIPPGGLEEWPADHDPNKHSPLRKRDFKNVLPFLKHKESDTEQELKRIRRQIKHIEAFGGDAEKAREAASAERQMRKLLETFQRMSPEVKSSLNLQEILEGNGAGDLLSLLSESTEE